MNKKISIIVLTAFIFINAVFAQGPSTTEKTRWNNHAKQTKIIRDEWGIPHIYGKTDADASLWINVCTMRRKFSADREEFFRDVGTTCRIRWS